MAAGCVGEVRSAAKYRSEAQPAAAGTGAQIIVTVYSPVFLEII